MFLPQPVSSPRRPVPQAYLDLIAAGFPKGDNVSRYDQALCERNPAAHLIASRYHWLATDGFYAFAGRPPDWALEDFKKRVLHLYDKMCKQITIQVCEGEPYMSADPMFHDIQDRGYMWVRQRKNGPVIGGLTQKWRAVHDYWGHYETRAPFTWSGEMLAYLTHCDQFPIWNWPYIWCNVVLENTYRLVNGEFFCKNWQCGSTIVHDNFKFGDKTEFYARGYRDFTRLK